MEEDLRNRQLTDSPLRAPELICDFYLVLLTSAYLLYFDQNGLTAITAAKRGFFYVLSALFLFAILLSCVLLCFLRPAARQQLLQRLRTAAPMLWCMLAYLALTLVSALLSEHTAEVWIGKSRNEGFVTQAFYVLGFAVLVLFARPKRLHLIAFGIGLLLLTIVSVLHLFRQDPLGLFPAGADFYNTEQRYLGTIGNVGFLGSLLCVAIPVLAAALVRLKGFWRYALLLPLVGCLLLLFSISVLAAYVGLLGGAVLCLPFVCRFSQRGTRGYFGIACCLGMIGLLLLYFFDFGGFFHELHALLHGQFSDSFGTGRFFIWRQTLERIPARIWFGYGPDTMLLESLEPFRRADEITGAVVKIAPIDAAHNEYLNNLFHQGVFALGAYLLGLGFAWRSFFREAKTSAAVAVCGAAVICYGIAAFFGISQPITSPYFWAVLGLLGAAVRKDPITHSISAEKICGSI